VERKSQPKVFQGVSSGKSSTRAEGNGVVDIKCNPAIGTDDTDLSEQGSVLWDTEKSGTSFGRKDSVGQIISCLPAAAWIEKSAKLEHRPKMLELRRVWDGRRNAVGMGWERGEEIGFLFTLIHILFSAYNVQILFKNMFWFGGGVLDYIIIVGSGSSRCVGALLLWHTLWTTVPEEGVTQPWVEQGWGMGGMVEDVASTFSMRKVWFPACTANLDWQVCLEACPPAFELCRLVPILIRPKAVILVFHMQGNLSMCILSIGRIRLITLVKNPLKIHGR